MPKFQPGWIHGSSKTRARVTSEPSKVLPEGVGAADLVVALRRDDARGHIDGAVGVDPDILVDEVLARRGRGADHVGDRIAKGGVVILEEGVGELRTPQTSPFSHDLPPDSRINRADVKSICRPPPPSLLLGLAAATMLNEALTVRGIKTA